MVENLTNEDDFTLNLDDSDEKPSGGKLKALLSVKVVIIVVAVLVVIGAGILIAVLFTGGDEPTAENETVETGSPDGVASQVFIPFEDIATVEVIELVLSDMGGEKRLIVGISLKIDQLEVRDELLREAERIRNSILSLLRTKTLAELSTVEGKIQLRNEIIRMLNDFLQEGHVVNLFFHKFLIM